MTFFFDNNLSPKIARGFKEFGEDVIHLTDVFPAATQDTDWLPVVGDKGWVLVTRDKRIRRRPAELAAYRLHGIGGFVLAGKKIEGWRIIRQLVNLWPRIKELAVSTPQPFLYRLPPNGSKIEAISLS